MKEQTPVGKTLVLVHKADPKARAVYPIFYIHVICLQMQRFITKKFYQWKKQGRSMESIAIYSD